MPAEDPRAADVRRHSHVDHLDVEQVVHASMQGQWDVDDSV
jgi:hypothetical protein